jgi:YD repeat-containing protein
MLVQGTRVMSVTYDSAGLPSVITDPLSPLL